MVFPFLQEIQLATNSSLREIMDNFSKTAIHTQGMGFGVVTNQEGRCVGVVTDGDIRRQLVNEVPLETPVEKIMNRDFVFARPGDTPHKVLRIFDSHVRHIPVLDERGRLINLLQFSDFNASARREERVIRSRAPVRVSFAGGGTDMSCYFKTAKGYVLSYTINKYCYASVRVRSDEKIRLISRDYQQEVEVDKIQQLVPGDPLDLIKACVRIMEPTFGFDLETYSEVEPGTGLGGSSAVSAAVVGALNHFRNQDHLDKYTLSDLAYQAERIELGVAGGWQDQYACVFGGLNLIEFRQDEIMVFPLRVPEDILLELKFNLLMFRFGSTRESGVITSDQESRLYADRALKSHYHQLAGLAVQMKDALVKGELNNLGRLLHEGWELKKMLSSKISNGHIDDLYDAARHAGALGGKVLGAGGGGYLLVYCLPADQSFVIEALQNRGARQEYFDFVETGLETWTAKC